MCSLHLLIAAKYFLHYIRNIEIYKIKYWIMVFLDFGLCYSKHIVNLQTTWGLINIIFWFCNICIYNYYIFLPKSCIKIHKTLNHPSNIQNSKYRGFIFHFKESRIRYRVPHVPDGDRVTGESLHLISTAWMQPCKLWI